MACKFHHVTLSVYDFEKALEFYKEVLGLKEVLSWMMGDTPAVMLKMDCGGHIELFGNGTPEPESNPSWIRVALEVDNVDTTYEKALEYGAETLSPPRNIIIADDGIKKIYCVFIKCPGGGVVQIYEYK